jgi:hypothetical protein
MIKKYEVIIDTVRFEFWIKLKFHWDLSKLGNILSIGRQSTTSFYRAIRRSDSKDIEKYMKNSRARFSIYLNPTNKLDDFASLEECICSENAITTANYLYMPIRLDYTEGLTLMTGLYQRNGNKIMEQLQKAEFCFKPFCISGTKYEIKPSDSDLYILNMEMDLGKTVLISSLPSNVKNYIYVFLKLNENPERGIYSEMEEEFKDDFSSLGPNYLYI